MCGRGENPARAVLGLPENALARDLAPSSRRNAFSSFEGTLASVPREETEDAMHLDPELFIHAAQLMLEVHDLIEQGAFIRVLWWCRKLLG